MMKKVILLLIPCVSTVFCSDTKRLQGVEQVSRYLGATIMINTQLAALYNKDFKRGMQVDFDMLLGCDNLLLTPEENEAVRKYAKKRLEYRDTTLAQIFELEKNYNGEIVEHKVEFEEYVDRLLSFFDMIGAGTVKATTHSMLGGAYSYPKLFTKNVTQNKFGNLAMSAMLSPLGFLQGFGADCYVKCLSADDNHRMLAWSKVVAWTGDGF